MPVTRRAFLGAAAVTAAGVSVDLPTRAAAATSPSTLHKAYGVCTHPNWARDPMWGHTDRWMEDLAELGVRQIRGLINPRSATCRRAAELCRRYDIKWLMPVAPPSFRLGPAEVSDRIDHIAAEYGDIVLGFEGVNEPNNTGRGDWADRTIAIQRAIWDARNRHHELENARVLSPSMHDVVEDRNNGAGYRQLAQRDVHKYCDVASLHSYPRGQEITNGLDSRLKKVDIAYDGMPVWITETGWTTYNGKAGHRPTSESDAARHGSEGIKKIAKHERVQKAFRYELLDDPGSGRDPETRFGLVRADWSRKPEYHQVHDVLAKGDDGNDGGNGKPDTCD
ncbi:glycosyl hydrolase [Nocardioides coralli]|uniref:glycosyl hydrolase n=1 Tax=Nocardioides coralli TaxID=2872154 RepID=UPI001CA3C1B6|nr:glycosyl hydrolase [Nocardioides coralli]QZY29788.1 hypothetical protein K6T13_03605 [Nocardioides coralli]